MSMKTLEDRLYTLNSYEDRKILNSYEPRNKEPRNKIINTNLIISNNINYDIIILVLNKYI